MFQIGNVPLSSNCEKQDRVIDGALMIQGLIDIVGILWTVHTDKLFQAENAKYLYAAESALVNTVPLLFRYFRVSIFLFIVVSKRT